VVQGVTSVKDVPPDFLLKTATKEDTMERYLTNLVYGKPNAHFDYVREICEADTDDEAF
jgi:hypothetical protein